MMQTMKKTMKIFKKKMTKLTKKMNKKLRTEMSIPIDQKTKKKIMTLLLKSLKKPMLKGKWKYLRNGRSSSELVIGLLIYSLVTYQRKCLLRRFLKKIWQMT